MSAAVMTWRLRVASDIPPMVASVHRAIREPLLALRRHNCHTRENRARRGAQQVHLSKNIVRHPGLVQPQRFREEQGPGKQDKQGASYKRRPGGGEERAEPPAAVCFFS